MQRRMARHFPQDGLQHRTHSYGSLELVVAERFFPRVMVGWRASYASLHCKRRTQTRRCFLVRASAAFSGVFEVSYSSSGAEHRDLSGSFLFIEQYHLDGSFFSSTTPRRRRHCHAKFTQIIYKKHSYKFSMFMHNTALNAYLLAFVTFHPRGITTACGRPEYG